MKVIALAGLLIFTQCSSAQTDTTLIKKAETQLQNGSATVSTILSDKKYLSLHPDASFRELIKKHSNADVLKMVTNKEPGKKVQVIGKV